MEKYNTKAPALKWHSFLECSISIKHDPTIVIINEELKQYFEKTDMLVGVDIIHTEDYSDWQ